MDEVFARVSKAGRVVCGRQLADGGYHCDEPIAAAIVRVHEPPRYPERRLVALPGWRMDRKSIWRRTTSVEDRRAHGRAPGTPAVTPHVELPALACCPKCGALQWLEAERLNVAAGRDIPAAAPSRWVIRLPEPSRSSTATSSRCGSNQ